MPPERASFASRLLDSQSASLDANDEDTFVNALATQPTAPHATQSLAKSKCSFASRAFECSADADAKRRVDHLGAFYSDRLGV